VAVVRAANEVAEGAHVRRGLIGLQFAALKGQLVPCSTTFV